jgi:putative ABC transport system ATP-binding protein
MEYMYGIRITGLTKSFPSTGSGLVYALSDLDIDIDPGQFVVVVGANGSGKTTLLNILAGDYPPDCGTIELRSSHATVNWLALARWDRAAYLARVHQDPRRGTAPGMTVWENLRLASSRSPVPSPFRFATTQHDQRWHLERLMGLGLAEKIDSRIDDLSQGQRQLLALELAMLREPAVLLLDEHTASLDQANAAKCLEATVRLSQRTSTTVIMVTHNLLDALRYGERLIIMRDGRIVEDLDGDDKRHLDMPRLLSLCGYIV